MHNQAPSVRERNKHKCCAKISQISCPSVKQASASFVDRMITTSTIFGSNLMIARLGSNQLASLRYIASLQSFATIAVTSGLSIAGGVLTRLYKRDPTDANIKSIVRESQILGILASFPIFAILLPSNQIIQLSGVDAAIADNVFEFFLIQSFMYPFMVSYLPSKQLFLGTNGKIFALLSNFILSSAQMGAAYCFSHGRLGFPNLGIRGIALSYVIKNFSQLVLNEIYLIIRKQSGSLKLFFGKKHLSFLWNKGWPVGLQYSLESVTSVVISILIGLLSGEALRISSISSQITVLLSPLIFGLAQATSYSVGRVRGIIDTSDNVTFKSIRNTGHKGLIIGFAVSGAILAAMAIDTDWYIRLFGGFEYNFTDADRHEMRTLILMGSAAQLLYAIRNTASGALKALYNTRFSFACSIFFQLCINIPLGATLGLETSQGLIGFSEARLATLALAASVMYLYMRYSTSENHWAIETTIEDRESRSFCSEVFEEGKGLARYVGSFIACKKKSESRIGMVNPVEVNNEQTPLLRNRPQRYRCCTLL